MTWKGKSKISVKSSVAHFVLMDCRIWVHWVLKHHNDLIVTTTCFKMDSSGYLRWLLLLFWHKHTEWTEWYSLRCLHLLSLQWWKLYIFQNIFTEVLLSLHSTGFWFSELCSAVDRQSLSRVSVHGADCAAFSGAGAVRGVWRVSCWL